MRLLSFELHNFGAYGAEVRFEFVREGRDLPIVLVGGQNGAGKTTLLEGLRLCLYGRRAFADGVSQSKYRAHLAERINRGDGSDARPRAARLVLAFEYTERGVTSEYLVTRRWWLTGDPGQAERLQERVELHKDGVEFEGLEDEHWADFVDDLVPLGVSQLFFFDGEKIQALAEDETADTSLATAIKMMLGLDLVEKLRADLAHYRHQQLRQRATGDDATALNDADKHLIAATRRLEELRLTAKALDAELDTARSRLRIVEEELRARGGAFADARDGLAERRGGLDAKQHLLMGESRKLLEGELPFACCPELSNRLLKQLVEEAEVRQAESVRSTILSAADGLGPRFESGEFGGAAPGIDALGLRELLLEVFQPQLELEPFEFVHDLSDTASGRVSSWLERARREAARAAEYAEELAGTKRALRKLDGHLALAPDEGTLKEVVDRLAVCTTEVERTGKRLSDQEEAVAVAERAHAAATRDVAKLRERVAAAEGETTRIGLAKRSASALLEYQRLLTEQKVQALRLRMTARFKLLARKEDLVSSVEIDPETFQVTLLDAHGHRIPRRTLSAGEKQVFAVAMLWGLADVSGRRLPMIIDTPLGRLDGEHRRNLIEHYFPHASHQVIILSTDTEVDRSLFAQLEPSISHAYRLEAPSAGGPTTVRPGYFWEAEA